MPYHIIEFVIKVDRGQQPLLKLHCSELPLLHELLQMLLLLLLAFVRAFLGGNDLRAILRVEEPKEFNTSEEGVCWIPPEHNCCSLQEIDTPKHVLITVFSPFQTDEVQK